MIRFPITAGIFSLVLLTAPALAAAPIPDARLLTESRICRDGQDGKPVDCGVPFDVAPAPPKGDPMTRGQVATSTRLPKGPARKIRHLWFQDGHPEPSGDVNFRSSAVTVQISRKRVHRPFSVGSWTVQVCDDQDSVLEILKFSVERASGGKLHVIPGGSERPAQPLSCGMPAQTAAAAEPSPVPYAPPPVRHPVGNSGCVFEPESADATHIRELSWHPDGPKPRALWRGEDYVYTVEMRGTYARKGWTLTLEEETIPLAAGGQFSLNARAEGGRVEFELVAYGPEKSEEREKFVMTCPIQAPRVEKEKVELAIKEETAEEFKRQSDDFSFLPGLGLSHIDYTQTRADPSSELALTAKLSVLWAFAPPSWYLGFTGFATVAAFSEKGANTPFHFVGLNLRAGYALPSVSDPWKLTLLGGAYYLSMRVVDGHFGFRYLWGPQVYPTLRRTLGGGTSLSIYGKYSPVTDGTSLLQLSNHELATGIAYGRTLRSGRSLSFMFDFSRLNFSKVSKVTGLPTDIAATTISGSVGYGL